MSWPTGSIPPEVTALRDMLGNCGSWTGNGGGVNQVHYPDFQNDTNLVMPAALIIREDMKATPYAAGAGALPGGTMRIQLFLAESISDAEAIANGIAKELGALNSGLPVTEAHAGLCEDISPGRQATIDDAEALTQRSIPIHITWGLSL